MVEFNVGFRKVDFGLSGRVSGTGQIPAFIGTFQESGFGAPARKATAAGSDWLITGQ
jgi:hypothetical protein